MILSRHFKIKGFGLFEILISLAIFAIGIISITSLNVKTYMVIKNNELIDFADRTMIKALEYFKAPTTTTTATTPGIQTLLEGWMNNVSNTNKVVNLSIDSSSALDDSTILKFKLQNFNNSSISECNLGEYKISTTTGSIYEGFDICEQVIIEKKENGYKITSRIVYKIATETKINQIIGYRPFTYVE
jgi:hypothetical protein